MKCGEQDTRHAGRRQSTPRFQRDTFNTEKCRNETHAGHSQTTRIFGHGDASNPASRVSASGIPRASAIDSLGLHRHRIFLEPVHHHMQPAGADDGSGASTKRDPAVARAVPRNDGATATEPPWAIMAARPSPKPGQSRRRNLPRTARDVPHDATGAFW